MNDGRDPYRAAGKMWCEEDQALGMPVDAAYITGREDGHLLLVEYRGDCDHTSQVLIIDGAALELDRRCRAVTGAGKRCRNWVSENGRCWMHAESEAI